MRPTRVGLVIGQLTAGGAEGQLLQVASELQGSAYEPIVYCMSDRTEPVGPRLQAAGVPTRIIAGRPSQRPAQLARHLAADDVRLVHAWLFIGNTYAWLATRRLRDVALITSARNCKRQGFVHDTANRFAFRASHRIICNSVEVDRYIQKVYRAPASRIAVIYNGVDTERFHPGLPSADSPLVLGLGRLVSQKDPGLFIRAAARLAAIHPMVRFAFAGGGPLHGELQRQLAAAGLQDRFELPGEISDVATWHRRASLFWLSSAWEGLPNVVLEAMASGVPAIATDVGGTREIVRSGVDGMLVRSGDAEGLARYSAALLGDEARRRSFGRSARARAQAFSTRRMIAEMVALYDDVGRGRGEGRA